MNERESVSEATWVEVGPGDWSLADLPYGVFSTGGNRHLGAAIGRWVLDLHRAANVGLFRGVVHPDVLMSGSLNPLLNLTPSHWRAVRERLTEILRDESFQPRVAPLLVEIRDIRLHLPWQISDFVDFYSSLQHAENVGKLFRPGGDPLLPNWRHIPVGYHGRAGTVVVSGSDIRRPHGIIPTRDGLRYVPSQRLDIEIELGFVLGNPSEQGSPVRAADAPSHIFGVVVVNDWSARDIQAFEYQPLGPFLGKSFATSVSAWVLPIAAIEGARTKPPPQSPQPARHLEAGDDWGLDITLDAWLKRDDFPAVRLSTTNARTLYWSAPQQIAHLTSNGTPIRAGDLIATGTISGDDPASLGSLLEITENGARPLVVGGRESSFLEDGDEVVITAAANRSDGTSASLGAVRGRIV
jgi:fumarylacetoacetase